MSFCLVIKRGKMPNPLTHILVMIILVELFREYFYKGKFPRYYILIAAIAAVIPDLDYFIYYFLYYQGFSLYEVHRTFLSSIFLPLIFLIIGLVIMKFDFNLKYMKKHQMKLSVILFIFAAGSFIHILLDGIFWGIVMPFYPFSSWEFGLNLVDSFPESMRTTAGHILDMLLLFFWLFWMEFKLKISDYF
ncbi:hypothetical protein GF386_02465 [Candidatus Pacearchaeota archaeon]|nr:hypothetical protein [Candidatus Pacearchaeota archaeon]MBD3283007.1 hypothetical protein [Candidatus Pacearchaeota archaeon]